MVNLLFYGGAFWLASIVFTVDRIVPASIPIGVAYIIVIIVGVWSPSDRYYFWAALFCTVLIILGYLVAPIPGEKWKAITYRGLAAVTLLGLVLFPLRRKV